MKDFLFKKDLWFWDLLAVISFSLFFGYKILFDSMTGKPKWAEILYGTMAYLFTFILAVSLKTKFPRLRSWVWLGIIGAFVRIFFLVIIHLPKTWNYHQQFAASEFLAVVEFSSDTFKIVLFNWIFWAIPGLLCIFAVRFVLFPFYFLYNLGGQKKDFPH